MPELLTTGVMLPTQNQKATRLSPRITVIYGVPKVGKTKVATELPGALIMDTEDGTAMYDNCLSVPIYNYKDLYDLMAELDAERTARMKAGKSGDDLFPYRYGVVDTLDVLESYADIEATRKYKLSKLCSDEFKANASSVTELPHGLGYYYLREEVIKMIDKLKLRFKYLILIVHVKEKLLDKKGEQVKVNDISLTGKLGSIVCSKADAIGYLSREGDKAMISFQTSEGNVMGARQKHLAGQKFEFSWPKIFID